MAAGQCTRSPRHDSGPVACDRPLRMPGCTLMQNVQSRSNSTAPQWVHQVQELDEGISAACRLSVRQCFCPNSLLGIRAFRNARYGAAGLPAADGRHQVSDTPIYVNASVTGTQICAKMPHLGKDTRLVVAQIGMKRTSASVSTF
jgi:hypothetical protein